MSDGGTTEYDSPRDLANDLYDRCVTPDMTDAERVRLAVAIRQKVPEIWGRYAE